MCSKDLLSCCRIGLIALNLVSGGLQIISLTYWLYWLIKSGSAGDETDVGVGVVAHLALFIVGCVGAHRMSRGLLIGYFVCFIIRSVPFYGYMIYLAVENLGSEIEQIVIAAVILILNAGLDVPCIVMSGILFTKGFPSPSQGGLPPLTAGFQEEAEPLQQDVHGTIRKRFDRQGQDN